MMVLKQTTNAKLNWSHGEIYICRPESVGRGAGGQFIRLCLQHGPASSLDFLATTGQPGEKVAHLLLHRSTSAQALVGGRLLTCPAPDGLVSVEVWAVAGQIHQAQVQAGRGQVGSQRVAPMGWRIVPDHGQ